VGAEVSELELEPAPLLTPVESVEEPEEWAFVDFLAFFLDFFGFASVVASVEADAPELAAGLSLLVPEAPEVVPAAPDVPELSILPRPVVEEPAAPVPLVPDAPEVSREPDAPLELLPGDGVVDEPLLDVLGSLLLELDGGDVVLVPPPPAAPAPCASAMEDTDAIITNDSDRIVVFSAMSNSLS
jgi:hypothetical protein